MGSRRLWVKLWATWYTTASHLGVGGMALHCGATLMTCVVWYPGRDDAWAEFDDGSPLPIEAIAQRCQEPPKVVAAALAKLQTRGTISRRTDGAWGFELFGPAQESADASRKRAVRAPDSPRTVHGQSVICPPEVLRIVEGEGEGEAEVAPSVLTTPTPPQEGTLPGIESESREHAAASKRKRAPRKPKPKLEPDPRAQPVIDRIEQLRVGLGLNPLQAAHRTPKHISERLADGVDPATMIAVVEARAAELRADGRGAEYFNAVSMFTGPGTQGPGGWSHSLAVMERAANPRAQRPQNHQRGPAPVSSRPTESRTATVRELMREDEAREAAARERQP